MVAGEAHAVGALGEAAAALGHVRHLHPGSQRAGIGLALGQLLEHVGQLPAVGHVEGLLVQVGLAPLCQHEHGLDGVQLGAGTVPERRGHQAGHVAAEAVDVGLFHPEGHGFDHRVPQRGCLVVQAHHVGPVLHLRRAGVEGDGKYLALLIELVEVLVGRRPGVVPGGVVGHPVEDELEAQRMRLRHQALEVGHGAKLGVDCGVVADGVVAAQPALAVHLPDGLDGHQPQDVHAHLAQPRQVGSKGVERAFGRVLADVDFVDVGAARPRQVRGVGGGGGCIGGFPPARE